MRATRGSQVFVGTSVRALEWAEQAIFKLISGLGCSSQPEVLRAFQFFFGNHVLLSSLRYYWYYGVRGLLFSSTMLASFYAAWWRGYYRTALAMALVFRVVTAFSHFPKTASHFYLDAFIVFLLLLFPAGNSKKENDREFTRLLSGAFPAVILSVYFYAGVQKLLQGYWHDGQFLGSCFFAPNPKAVCWTVVAGAKGLAATLGQALPQLPLERSADLRTLGFSLPGSTVAFVLAMSWIILLTELLVPLLPFLKSTRRFALPVLLGMQLAIGISSWETEFMFGALGCILLLTPYQGERKFYWLAALNTLWAIGVVGFASGIEAL